MMAVEVAAKVYETEPCPRTFREDLEHHLLNGYVFNTPTLFVMGRPVKSNAPAELIVNPSISFPKSEADCWHVYLAAGNLREGLKYVPFRLPLISFERRNKLLLCRIKRIETLILRHEIGTNRSSNTVF